MIWSYGCKWISNSTLQIAQIVIYSTAYKEWSTGTLKNIEYPVSITHTQIWAWNNH